MRALVTGGGGFLGGAIVTQLLELGWRVRSYSRSRYCRLEDLGVEQHGGDLRQRDRVAQACRDCDVVYHVAARAGVGLYRPSFFDANVVGTRYVIEGCREAGVPRLVYTSSPSVIFDGSDMEGVDESVPYPDHYHAPYPETKAIAEREVLAASGPELATVALRPHLIWGPGDTHILPGLVERARRGRLRRIGDGSNKADFTYIDDAARAHLLAARALGGDQSAGGRAYFITQDEPVRLWEFVNRLLAAVDAPLVTKSVPRWLAMAAAAACEAPYRLLGRQDDPPVSRFLAAEMATSHWFDVSAARRDLGYQPRTSVEEGLRRLRAWYLRQK